MLDWKISDGYFLPGKEMLSCAVTALPQHSEMQRTGGAGIKQSVEGTEEMITYEQR